MKILIDNKEFPEEAILKWENSRMEPTKRFLEKRLHKPCSAKNPAEFAAYKMSIAPDEMLAALAPSTKKMTFATKPVVRLSAGRRKISVTEIDVDFCDAKTLHELYFDMMLNNTEENLLCCLRANPEHFLVRGAGGTVQEVVEFSGGTPLPEHFFIHYGDETFLVTKHDKAYPLEACGVSYLGDGTPIGAVRHQMKDTLSGCHVKLMVEFPALMPDKNIRVHQYHLACEFYNWFTEFERRAKCG